MNKLDEKLYRAVANLMMDPVILLEVKDRDSGGELVTIRDKGIKAIKQSFKDAGYMTGAEWYKLYKSELNKHTEPYGDIDTKDAYHALLVCNEAAKRVSGVRE